MSASQRRKGANGEREAHKVLWEQLGDVVERRDLSQTRDGGGDIRIPAARVLVEVKRVEQRAVPTWLRQATESAKAQGEAWVGVVMWRRDRGEWRFFVSEGVLAGNKAFGYVEWWAEDFCDWVRGRL